MQLTIAAVATLFERRDASPVEVVRSCLDRIALYDTAIHAFLRVLPERALAEARLAEERMMRGTRLSPLDGIPIAHKDTFNTAGIETTANSARYLGRVPERDAAVVESLRRAGSVMIGKVACDEGAFAGPSYDLPWLPPRNPWELDRPARGSIDGAAAAVAAGFVLGATGSDTGGSLRDPAGLCGVTGFKPSFHLCSCDGLLPFAPSLDTVGPIARSVADCALMLGGMLDRPADFGAASHAGVAGLRVGLVPGWIDEAPVSPAVAGALDAASDILRGSGAHLSPLDLPPLAAFGACGWSIAMAELHEIHHGALLRDGGETYGRKLRMGLAVGAGIPAHSYISALRRRSELSAAMRTALVDVDVLLLPARHVETGRLDEPDDRLPFERPSFTMPFDVTGQPAIVIPAGAGRDGSPFGLQLAAHPGRENVLLGTACFIERILKAHERRPDLSRLEG